MPIFHDYQEDTPRKPSSHPSSFSGPQRAAWAGDGSGRMHTDTLPSDIAMNSPSHFNMEPVSPNGGHKSPMLNRVELIERIKRGNSPSWPQVQNDLGRLPTSSEHRPASRDRQKTPRRPSAEPQTSRTGTPDPLREYSSAGYEIERPRSALHSGDFREKKEDRQFDNATSSSRATLATSPVAPWHHSFPSTALPASHGETPFSIRDAMAYEPRPAIRSRVASQSSFSSSFVFMPPTSPLVQQSNNTDLDFSSRPVSRQSSKSPVGSSRRHTFSPHSFQTFRSTQMARSASGTPAARHMRREGSFPYQAHQPRRSLTSSNLFQPHSSPQTPLDQSRRPSFSSDASPLHHAPMVGSYEESILRGRMSTTPSRPLNFVAQIGVLGLGECKSNLRCPPHVTVPFPAVFYSYSSVNGRIADNSPSPYVGLIDLENSLSPPEGSGESRRKRRHTIPNPDQDEMELVPSARKEPLLSKDGIRRREKKKRRSTSPKAPPGGSYRMPQRGQLQIVLKNPNKTAVKLFLVPYDLSDMEPGQKTFIRQRSYSAGPIIDMPLATRNNLGTDRPEAALSSSDDPNDRPVLRYLIHLHICCPSKGRYFLYKSIRVVFANRVPDGKERLRNEVQMPEPRYSSYKPTRDPIQTQPSAAATQLTTDKAFRRRSAGLSLSHHGYDRIDMPQRPPPPPPAIQFTGGGADRLGSPMPTYEPIPFSLPRSSGSITGQPMDPSNPFQSLTSSSSLLTGMGSPVDSTETFGKLSKGDVGYGGNAFFGNGCAASPSAGLLTRRLRGLDVQPDEENNC